MSASFIVRDYYWEHILVVLYLGSYTCFGVDQILEELRISTVLNRAFQNVSRCFYRMNDVIVPRHASVTIVCRKLAQIMWSLKLR